MAVPSPSATKSELRAGALARRRAFAASLTGETRAADEAALIERLLPHLVLAEVIGLYHPLAGEISPLSLITLLGSGPRMAFPWFADRDARMIWREGPATEPGPWRVPQPSGAAVALVPDTVIVPIVLTDRAGTRIGHGKGHYDRALAHLRKAGTVRTIGIGWDWQLSNAPIPRDPWDVPLDSIATPGEWVSCV